MEDALKKRCRDFVSAEKKLSKVQPLLMPHVYPLCAQILLLNNQTANLKKLKECDELLFRETSSVFEFSGTSGLVVSTELSLSEDPESLLKKVKEAKRLLVTRFPALPEALSMAAFALTTEPRETWESLADTAKEIYHNTAKKKGHLLPAGADLVYSLLLAQNPERKDRVLEETERCYTLLKEALPKADPVTVSRLLAISSEGTPEEKTEKFINMYHRLNEKGHSYGKQYHLPDLALVSLADAPAEELVEEIISVEKFLRRLDLYRGLLGWYSSQAVRTMHAAKIVFAYHVLDVKKQPEITLASRIAIWSLLFVLFV